MSDEDPKAKRASELLVELLGYYRSYHNHKESMAYAGITLYGGVGAASILSRDWPPDWGPCTHWWATLAIAALWLFFLLFLRFQLHRRRWAALRSAGAERLLAKWVQAPPSADDLAYRPAEAKRSPESPILDWLWPQARAVLVVEVDHQVYPKCFVEAWLEQEKHGTDAIHHERLIVIAGWIVTALSVAKVWLT